MKNTPTDLVERLKEKRIWVFVAYKNNVPYFSKLFDDFDEMKIFSGKHRHSGTPEESKTNFHSTYFDLTDKSLVEEIVEKAREERERIKEIILRRTEIPEGARNPTRDSVVILGEQLVDLIDSTTNNNK